jgi:hypothetical protein
MEVSRCPGAASYVDLQHPPSSREAAIVLFHIEQVHSPENCPYGNGGSRSLHDASVAGVEVKGVYGAFSEHTIFLLVEATDIEALNLFLVPGMKTCTATITPVSTDPLPQSR